MMAMLSWLTKDGVRTTISLGKAKNADKERADALWALCLVVIDDFDATVSNERGGAYGERATRKYRDRLVALRER